MELEGTAKEDNLYFKFKFKFNFKVDNYFKIYISMSNNYMDMLRI